MFVVALLSYACAAVAGGAIFTGQWVLFAAACFTWLICMVAIEAHMEAEGDG